MVTPILRNEYIVTSPYGDRKHPVTGEHSFHYGIDIVPKDPAEGVAVYSVAPGVVVDAYDAVEGYSEIQTKGNYVRIRHSSGRESLYLHLQKGVKVNIGQKVYADTILGIMGSTGRSTGPHVHFQLYETDGSILDPTVFVSSLNVNAKMLPEYVKLKPCAYGEISMDVVNIQRALCRISDVLQEMVRSTGYEDGAYDGIYGKGLKKAVAAYQRIVGLDETGLADSATVALLDKCVGKK